MTIPRGGSIPPIVTLPRPRDGMVDEPYIIGLIRSIETFLRDHNNPGPIRGWSLNLPGLPDNGSGLRDGDVFDDEGTLKIVRGEWAYAPPLLGTGALGTVTVSTA